MLFMELFLVMLISYPIFYVLSVLLIKVMRLMSDYETRNQEQKTTERNTVKAFNRVFPSQVDIPSNIDQTYQSSRFFYDYNSASGDYTINSAEEKRTFPTPDEFLEHPELEFSASTYANATGSDLWNAEHDPRYWMLSENDYSFQKQAEREREEEARKQAEAEEAWRRRMDDEWYEEQRRREDDY